VIPSRMRASHTAQGHCLRGLECSELPIWVRYDARNTLSRRLLHLHRWRRKPRRGDRENAAEYLEDAREELFFLFGSHLVDERRGRDHHRAVEVAEAVTDRRSTMVLAIGAVGGRSMDALRF
jgi:hypothetical protein